MKAITDFSKSIVGTFAPSSNGAESLWTDRVWKPGEGPKEIAKKFYDSIWETISVQYATLKHLDDQYLLGSAEVWTVSGPRQMESVISFIEVPEGFEDDADRSGLDSPNQATLTVVNGTMFLVEQTRVLNDVTIGSRDPVNADEVRVKGERPEFDL